MEQDRRPVTWGTLIEALREANYHEEVDILEKHLVPTESGVSVVSQPGMEICIVQPRMYFQNIQTIVIFVLYIVGK